LIGNSPVDSRAAGSSSSFEEEAMDRDTPLNTSNMMHASPMELVREGMTVVDSAGDKVGTIEDFKMGDSGAATDAGNELPDGGFLGDVARVFGDEGEPDVPGAARERLLRTGYIKIDGPGFLVDTDRYVPADQVDSVSGDTVRLRVTKDMLVKED
jgi:hypothetical protein